MHVPEIIEVKETLEKAKQEGLIESWELPYENILTRRSAAIFFVTLKSDVSNNKVWDKLEKYEHFSFRENHEKKLSALKYRVTFSEVEKEKNMAKN